MNSEKTISIIGLGLIGGSIAKGLRKQAEGITINAYDYKDVIEQAISEENIDSKLTSIESAADSDIIFLCLPTGESLNALRKIAPLVKSGALITDVAGVKSIFYEEWKNIESRGTFIGGHPMTGKEKGGYENSDPLLFENSVYILSSSLDENENFTLLKSIIKKLGARIKFVDPYLHDKVIAFVSHLPQLSSVALVNSASKKDDDINFLDFAAGGFRDMTRIASSGFNIWGSVIKQNKKFILEALSAFQEELELMKEYVGAENLTALESLFESSARRRDEIPKNTKGFLNPLFEIYVYVKDEPGVLSKLTTALFDNSINIKDLELLKIREGTGGTFRISLESQSDAEAAKQLIENLGFTTK